MFKTTFRLSAFLTHTSTKWHRPLVSALCQQRHQPQVQTQRGKKDDSNVSALFRPVPVKPSPDDISIGMELTGKLDKGELLKVLNRFTQKREIKMLCTENGLDSE